MQRAIINFHQDEFGDWVADLECGHGQHVRHNPPWEERPWAVDPKSRAQRIGHFLDCRKCDHTLAEDANRV